MARGSLAICLFLLTAVQLRSAWLRLRGPIPAGPPRARREAFATETEPSDRSNARQRDRRLACCPVSAQRELPIATRLLVGGTIDPSTLSVRDWDALPHVGPRRAASLVAAHGSLAAARLPPSVRAQISRRLGLDEAPLHDICSLGSWPTTSSACGKLR